MACRRGFAAAGRADGMGRADAATKAHRVSEAEAQDRRAAVNAQRAAAQAGGTAVARRTEIGRTMPRINLSIRLGPMVHVEVQGETCAAIADALDGFQRLNAVVDEMFSDLAERVYPGGEVPDGPARDTPG